LINGKRKTKDGVAFFGSQSEDETFPVNDYVINYQSNFGAHLFFIYYNKSVNGK